MDLSSSALHKDIAEILISQESLQKRVLDLGKEITRSYEGKSILAVGVLKGAAVFLADLIRAIELPVDYDFVWLSSYGDCIESSGIVRIRKDVEADVSGKHVLIVEDIVDTGWTLRMSRLTESLLARNAASVRVCTLLDKPSRRKVDVAIDFRGFEIEDKFVVGYGLDLAGRYRNLPYIGLLKPEILASVRGIKAFSDQDICSGD